MRLGFDTHLVSDEVYARSVVEKFIWATTTGNKQWPNQIIEIKKLVIWFLRQSKELSEEIVLHSPFDCNENGTYEVGKIAISAAYWVHNISSSGASIVPFGVIMDGVGSSLCLNGGVSGRIASLYLTFDSFDYRKARRLKWEDAVAGIKKIEVPKADR